MLPFLQSHNPKNITPFRAMSLVEVMVAIAVFGIGILGVLQIVVSMMKIEDRVTVQTAAVALAQESLQLVYHIRDTNKMIEQQWDCVPDNREQRIANRETDNKNCLTTFTELRGTTNGLQLSFSSDEKTPYAANVVSLGSGFQDQFEATRLLTTNYQPITNYVSYYTHITQSGSLQQTPFARYLTFTGVNGFQGPNISLYKVTSHGLYTKGSLTGEVLLESFIGKLDKEQAEVATGGQELFTIGE